MPPERPPEPRPRTDRRRRPTSPWGALRPRNRGRRLRPRRVEERRPPYFVDRIDGPSFGLAVLLVILTVVDGAATLLLLGAGCEEINPAMNYLLKIGPVHFLMGKYALTAAGLPFLLIFRYFPLFGTRFRVGHLLAVFVALYVVLLAYQVALMNAHDDRGAVHNPGDRSPPVSYVPTGFRLGGRVPSPSTIGDLREALDPSPTGCGVDPDRPDLDP